MSVTISPGRPEFHDLVTGRWLSVVSTSEPCDEPAIFFIFLSFYLFFHCTIQQRRIAVQYSVIVEGNLMLCHQHHPHYDHFAVTINFTKMQWWYSMGMILVDNIQMVVTYCMSYHHTELTRGRTQSYHHMDVTHRRTVNMSLCPTTTWT